LEPLLIVLLRCLCESVRACFNSWVSIPVSYIYIRLNFPEQKK